MENFKHFYKPQSRLILKAGCGATILDCTKEAITIALGNSINVTFIHNDRQFNIDPDAIISTIKGEKVKHIE